MTSYEKVIKTVNEKEYPDVTRRAVLCSLTGMREYFKIDFADDILKILHEVQDENEIIKRVFWRRNQSIRFHVLKTMQEREYAVPIRKEIIKMIGEFSFEYGIDLGPQALLILHQSYDEYEVLGRIKGLFSIEDYIN